ncbi:MAG: DUF2723 domain-containing protein [Rhodothermales bacterium]
MNVNWKLTERVIGAFVFTWAFVLYLLTVAPTASFWDSGEFIAIANRLQVSHPPGAPFFMLIGRFFSMFVPLEYVSLAVNMVSVLSSALTVLLTHLIIVRIAREWETEAAPSLNKRLTVLAGGVIGALTFAATDSFWFNAVEAEVYALSMFFTAVVVWLILKWSEQARLEEQAIPGKQHPFGLSANRYLVLIAYMFGLAIGVHLLNLLAIFFIALIFYFAEFYREDMDRQTMILGIFVTGAISTLCFLAIYPGIITWLPGFVGSSFSPMLTMILIVSAIVFGIYITHRRNMQVTNLIFVCAAVVFIGYSTYALIFIRSAANPPIDENDPEDAESIVSYLKREQYGSTPLLTGNSFDNETQQIDPEKEVFFPRRYSPTPLHMRYYAQFDSDSEFFWKYQINNMYVRYFLWNFAGRASDVQDAPAITGIPILDPPEYGADRFVQTPSERSSRNVYFALPLLLGLFGGVYHFRRDWKRAFSVFVLFFVTGIGIILYLNQTPYQPRERDYAYVASFFAFSIWVGIGATGILQLLLEALSAKERSSGTITNILYGVSALLFLCVPLWMTTQNYHDHNRSGRYVAPEYAYNMLHSVEDDAILITNGDNDTFPLWYLQEVEQERQDVRVVNISLLNTPWYIKQLKNQSSRDSAPLPFSMTNDRIEELEIIPWKPDQLSLPVDLDQILGSSEVPIAIEDTSLLESPMTWTLNGRPYSDQFNLLYVSDQALLDILITNAKDGWKRPIYYAVTVSQDGQLDLENYFQLEGQAFRIVPIKHNELLGRAIPSITPENLKKFKFTNLDNPDVYFDENIRRMVDNYRNVFVQTAQTMYNSGDIAGAAELLDFLMEKIPFEVIPGTERSHLIVARAYQLVEENSKAVEIWKKAEPIVLSNLKQAGTQAALDQTARFMQMIQIGYMEVGDYDAASAFTNQIADAIGDQSYRKTAEEFEADSRRIFPPAATPDTSSGE